MFDFLFTKAKPLGAYKSPADPRNVSIAAVQAPIDIPDEYETDMTAVRDQGQIPKCVASSTVELAEMYLASQGIFVDLSDDDLYAQCKAVDGIPELPGTYPTVCAYIATSRGIATVGAFKTGDKATIEASRAKHRFGGYAFVPASFEAICQAIYQNKAVTCSLSIDKNWFKGKIRKVLESVGRHQIVLKGYLKDDEELRGRNSWGVAWIGYIAGHINKAIKPGDFEVRWKDIKDDIVDIIAYLDIPLEVKEEFKSNWTMKYFTPLEVQNLKLPFVEVLDKARGIAGTPFKLTSGYRTPEQNKKAGGAPNSSHLRGLAVDIACTDNATRTKILRGLLTCGTALFIEICEKHIHVDMDPSIHPMGGTMWADDE